MLSRFTLKLPRGCMCSNPNPGSFWLFCVSTAEFYLRVAGAKSPKKMLCVLYKAAVLDQPLVSLFPAFSSPGTLLQAAHHPGSPAAEPLQLAKA